MLWWTVMLIKLFLTVEKYLTKFTFEVAPLISGISFWIAFLSLKKNSIENFGNANRGRRTTLSIGIFNKVPVAILVRVRWSLLVHDTASTLMNCLMQRLLAGMNWLWLLLLLLLSHISTICWKYFAIFLDLAWNSRHQMIFYVKLLTQLSIIKFVMTNKVWVINNGLLSFQFDGWELGYLSRSQSKFE